MNSFARSPLAQYRSVGAHGAVEAADPHRLVSLLYDGLSEALSASRGAIERGDVSAKTKEICKAAGIVDALRSSLNMDRGGEMAVNLDRLYEFMSQQITQANLHDDVSAVEATLELAETLRGAWAGIPESERQGTIAA